MQGETENALGDLQRMRQEQGKAQAEVSAAMQDAREALARERDIQDQLQKADQVRGMLTLHGCRPHNTMCVRTCRAACRARSQPCPANEWEPRSLCGLQTRELLHIQQVPRAIGGHLSHALPNFAACCMHPA